MKINSQKNIIGIIITASVVAILLFALIFLWMGVQGSSQSKLSSPADIAFEGEYRIGDGEWREIKKGEHIPSTQGDVTLRGIFMMYAPTTGEAKGPVKDGNSVYLYLNHIGGQVIMPEGGKIVFDAENDRLGQDACAKMWGSAPSLGTTPVTIVLHNPHAFGNENAIDDLLNNISGAYGSYHESQMLEKGDLQRNIGLLVLISSVVIIGIAIFSTVIHVKKHKEMWLIGLMSLFAGGYISFDAFAISIWNDSYITNTRMLGLCMMFYMLFSTMLIATQMKGRIKKLALFAVLASGISMGCCIALSLFGNVKFFDTWLGWIIAETCVVLILIVCLAISLRHSGGTEKALYFASIALLIAFPTDCLATAFGWWAGGFISKLVFYAVFIFALIMVLLVIPTHINAAARARELEEERQVLKRELQENRISIMLSQMQPHFISNTLNTIYHLCDIDPDKARSTISSFSVYLRNNMDNLGQSEMIPFEKELSFINAYLDIEKVRFDDELLIFFDIKCSNFKLPVLTVQPIVENAVKHGTSKKEGVSHLYISTAENEDSYEIEIRDTGVGFDASAAVDDGHKHIGITNVRQRLESLCNGTLTIDSTPGVGTVALIKIPKTEVSAK